MSKVPTPRIDKDGRIVIRRVITPLSQKNAIGVTPTSQRMRSLVVTRARASLTSVLRKSIMDSYLKDMLSESVPVLASYSDATLERVLEHRWNSESAEAFLIKIAQQWTETTANDYMEASSALRLPNWNRDFELHAASWQLYPSLHPANNEGEYPAERLSQITALTRIVDFMQHHERGFDTYAYDERTKGIFSMYLHPETLREFILNPEQPYNREEIMNVILTHDTFDVDHIKSILDTSAPALRGGVL